MERLWSEEKYQTVIREALNLAGSKGMTKEALQCYCDNKQEIEVLEGINRLLVSGELDARWNEQKEDWEIRRVEEQT